jgi:hypothetical protein
VWINDGNGFFTDSGQILGNSWSGDVGLADFDGDGDLDAFVSTTNPPYTNKVYVNDGSGNFTDSGQSLGNSNTWRLDVGDVDLDGDLDVMVGNQAGGANKVWLNNGTGVFTDSGQNLGNSASNGTLLGDLDGDGDLDAFAFNMGGQPNRVWLNQLVQYACVGFNPPMDHSPVKVKKKRALPLKMQLLDSDGFLVTDESIEAAPVIQVSYTPQSGGDPTDVSDEALPAGLGTLGNQFVFTEDQKWQYNLKTNNLTAPGTYLISIVPGNSYVINPNCGASFVIE